MIPPLNNLSPPILGSHPFHQDPHPPAIYDLFWTSWGPCSIDSKNGFLAYNKYIYPLLDQMRLLDLNKDPRKDCKKDLVRTAGGHNNL